MDVYKVCPATAFHRRVTSDIPLPSDSTLLWSHHRCALPRPRNYGMANRNLLCHGGYLPLLGPSCSPLGSPLQEYPQNSPSIFRAVRSCRRIRTSSRSIHPRSRNSGITHPFLCDNTKFTFNHHVCLDYSTVLSFLLMRLADGKIISSY